ncbi:hypothetical protein D3C78_952030 [compost metagenome]
MYIDAIIAVFAPVLRIWTSNNAVLREFISGHSYATSIEIDEGTLTTINVMGLKHEVLHSEVVDYPFHDLKYYAECANGISVLSLRNELQPQYKTKVVCQPRKIILTLEWNGLTETEKKHQH